MIKTIKKMLVFLTVGGLVLSGVTGCNNSTEASTAVTEESPATDRKDAKATTEERARATTEDAEPTTESSAGKATETASNTTNGNTGTSTGKSNTGTSTTGRNNTGTSTGNTGTSNSGTTTGGNTSNTNTNSNTNSNTSSNSNSGNTNPPATEAPATEAPATEATTEATVAYYRDWDYICRRTNELLQQNFPGAVIEPAPSYQTLTDYDGYPFPLPYDDEAAAQSLYECIANSLVNGGVPLGSDTPVATGLFVQSITETGYERYPNRRTVVLIYYK